MPDQRKAPLSQVEALILSDPEMDEEDRAGLLWLYRLLVFKSEQERANAR